MPSQPVTSQPGAGPQKPLGDYLKLSKEPELVLIAELTSRQEIKLRIKQNDDIPGAKVCCWQNLCAVVNLFFVLCMLVLTRCVMETLLWVERWHPYYYIFCVLSRFIGLLPDLVKIFMGIIFQSVLIISPHDPNYWLIYFCKLMVACILLSWQVFAAHQTHI